MTVFSSVPEPSLTPESIRDAVLALKENVEQLTGQRGAETTSVSAIEARVAALEVLIRLVVDVQSDWRS